MNSAKANQLVLISAMFTFGTTFFASFVPRRNHKPGFPSIRFFIGTLVVYIVLGSLADTQPKIAAPFALAIMATALTVNGGMVLTYYQLEPIKGKAKPATYEDLIRGGIVAGPPKPDNRAASPTSDDLQPGDE